MNYRNFSTNFFPTFESKRIVSQISYAICLCFCYFDIHFVKVDVVEETCSGWQHCGIQYKWYFLVGFGEQLYTKTAIHLSI